MPPEVPEIPLERTRNLLPAIFAVTLGLASVGIIVRLPNYIEALARWLAARPSAHASVVDGGSRYVDPRFHATDHGHDI